MAYIGSSGPLFGVQHTFNQRQAPALSPTALGGPGEGCNLSYGRQAMGDIDLVMALLALLQSGQAGQGGDQCSQVGGVDGSSLRGAGGKGAGASLRAAGGKGASLRAAGGKGVNTASLRRAGGK